jgi:hypothetical protein
LYEYVHSRPLTSTDTWGEFAIIGVIGAGLCGACIVSTLSVLIDSVIECMMQLGDLECVTSGELFECVSTDIATIWTNLEDWRKSLLIASCILGCGTVALMVFCSAFPVVCAKLGELLIQLFPWM